MKSIRKNAHIIIKSSLHKLSLVIKNVDLFGQSITLNINQQQSYKTIFGGLSSILILVILIAIFQSNISAFFARSDVIYGTWTEFQPNPEQIQMNSKNFMAAFSIEQENFITNPMFNISIEQRQYIRNTQGGLDKKTIYLQLEPCTLTHFEILRSQQQEKFENEFKTLDLDNWLCPKQFADLSVRKDYQFNLSGTYTSDEFNFIRIIVSDCKNNVAGYDNWKPTCASDKDRKQHLDQQGQFKLQIYQINSVVNPNQPKDYYQTNLDGEMYFTFVPYKLSRQANLFYRKYKFYNDQSLLPFEDIIEKELIVRQTDDYRDLTELGRDTDQNYAIIYLRRSQFSEYIERRNLKVVELLSFLGGFLQIMIVGSGIIINFYNQLSMQIEISNKLYNMPKKKDKFQPCQIFNTEEDQRLNETIEMFQKHQTINHESSLTVLQGQSLYKAIILAIQQKRMKFSIKSFINYISFGLIFQDEQSQIMQKALKKVNSDLDIYEILYQLKEIDKLKELLMTSEQIALFNFHPKPPLNVDNAQESFQKLDQLYCKDNNLLGKKENYIDKFYKSWVQLSNEDKYNVCQKDMNKKLQQGLGLEIIRILQEYDRIQLRNESMMQNNTSAQLIQLINN